MKTKLTALATDLAAKNPGKLKELQALFDKEARKYNVYPMVNSIFELLLAPVYLLRCLP